jgi:hypothetical protein
MHPDKLLYEVGLMLERNKPEVPSDLAPLAKERFDTYVRALAEGRKATELSDVGAVGHRLSSDLRAPRADCSRNPSPLHKANEWDHSDLVRHVDTLERTPAAVELMSQISSHEKREPCGGDVVLM